MRARVFDRTKTMTVAMLCLCLVFASLVNVKTASAMVYMMLDSRPAPISDDTTPTFVFDGYDMDIDEPYTGSIECKIDSGPFTPCTSPYTASPLAVGNHTFTVHAVGDSHPLATITHTWNINQTPTFSGGSSVSGVAGVPVAVTDLQISDVDNDVLGVKLSVPSGTLQLGVTTGITFAGSSTGSTITFSGTRTNLNSALATLVYTPASAGTVNIDATLTGANGGDRETFNGHFYRLIESPVTWSTAKAAAEASTYGGVSGYLATVTSAAEEDYLEDRMSDGVWIGAGDSVSEGDWRWVGGPENGTSFWNGGAVGGAYTNWQALQPDNNSGNENCLELRKNSSEAWNDENCGSSRQYMIEYGTDDALPSLATAQVSAIVAAANGDLDNDGIANAVEANAPNGGDANNDGTADYTQANVTSQYSALSGGYVVLQTSCTSNQLMQLSAESSTKKDSGYDYPYGLAHFTSTGCGAPGSTATITQYYYGSTDPQTLTLRKWNSTTGIYSTISDTTLSGATIGGKQAIKVAYQVVDGGSLDQDSTANSSITDPVGLAVVAVEVPNTGIESRSILELLAYGIFGLSSLAACGFMLRRYGK